MRIPFPERITPWHAGVFGVVLCTLEVLQGTHLLFALCVFVYIMLATIAFNLAGGMYRASGAYIFASAILGLLLSQVAKVLTGEAADSNLRAPMLSILVYMVGMWSVLLAIVISRKFIPKVPLLERNVDASGDIRQVAIGCFAVGVALPFLGLIFGNAPGTIGSALNQFQQFLPLGLMLALYDRIHSTKGRSSLNLIFILGSLYMIALGGIMATSKQALITPLAIYAVVCGALRFKLKPAGLAAVTLCSFFIFYYLVPYAQVVRNFTRGVDTGAESRALSIYWLQHLDEVREMNDVSGDEVVISANMPHYYSENRGFLERLGMLSMDDLMIDTAQVDGFYGYQPTIYALGNIIPRFLWPGKPSINYNNVYAHKVGLLGPDDFDTSVSFGPAADSYFEGGWVGVLVLMPVVLILMFVVVDSVSGDLRKTPWGLIYTLFFLHQAPEGMLLSCLCTGLQYTLILVVTVYAARYILPIVAGFVAPERRRLKAVRNVQSLPKAVSPSDPVIAAKTL